MCDPYHPCSLDCRRVSSCHTRPLHAHVMFQQTPLTLQTYVPNLPAIVRSDQNHLSLPSELSPVPALLSQHPTLQYYGVLLNASRRIRANFLMQRNTEHGRMSGLGGTYSLYAEFGRSLSRDFPGPSYDFTGRVLGTSGSKSE